MKLNRNHILITNFPKLCKYQTFDLIELHNLSKCQLVDRIFKLWKSCVYVYQAIKHTIFEILAFQFFQLWNNFCQKCYEKTSVSKYVLNVLIKFYHVTNIYDFKFFGNETMALWIFLEIVQENVLLLKFCQMREISKPQFCWYF